MLEAILEEQCGVLTAGQASMSGVSRARIRAHLDAGRWQRVYVGVYATFSGPLPRRSQLWAAVLYAGADGMLSHQSAAEVVGLCAPGSTVHVTVPAQRRLFPPAGIVVHRRNLAAELRHPVRIPPQTRIEHTVIDLTQAAVTLAEATEWPTRACAKRLTTPARLLDAIATQRKLRWRTELTEALGDVALGCHSALERRYLHDVEEAHRLPPSSRQALRRTAAGTRYDDVRYLRYRVAVELDGRIAHPDEARRRDLRRDNTAVAEGDRVLRYG